MAAQSQVMHKTGADFTNTFRWLAMVEMPPASSHSSGSHHNGESSALPQAEDRASNGTSISGPPSTLLSKLHRQPPLSSRRAVMSDAPPQSRANIDRAALMEEAFDWQGGNH